MFEFCTVSLEASTGHPRWEEAEDGEGFDEILSGREDGREHRHHFFRYRQIVALRLLVDFDPVSNPHYSGTEVAMGRGERTGF